MHLAAISLLLLGSGFCIILSMHRNIVFVSTLTQINIANISKEISAFLVFSYAFYGNCPSLYVHLNPYSGGG